MTMATGMGSLHGTVVPRKTTSPGRLFSVKYNYHELCLENSISSSYFLISDLDTHRYIFCFVCSCCYFLILVGVKRSSITIKK